MSESVARARAFAITAHGDQRYGQHPYVYHLDTVAEILQPYGETARILGYLHDVLEDTPVTFDELIEAFGRHTAECVERVTDEPGATRAERKLATNAKLADTGESHQLALVVKAADRLANLRESAKGGTDSKLSMYQAEHTAFCRAVYRPKLCDELWAGMTAVLDEAR